MKVSKNNLDDYLSSILETCNNQNWDSITKNCLPINEKIINKTKNLISKLKIDAFYLSPASDGSIHISVFKNDYKFLVEVFEDKYEYFIRFPIFVGEGKTTNEKEIINHFNVFLQYLKEISKE